MADRGCEILANNVTVTGTVGPVSLDNACRAGVFIEASYPSGLQGQTTYVDIEVSCGSGGVTSFCDVETVKFVNDGCFMIDLPDYAGDVRLNITALPSTSGSAVAINADVGKLLSC